MGTGSSRPEVATRVTPFSETENWDGATFRPFSSRSIETIRASSFFSTWVTTSVISVPAPPVCIS